MPPRLSKSRLLDYLQCPKRLWLQAHRPETREESAAMHLAFANGHEVGEAARALVPGGVLIEPPNNDLARALRLTRELLAARPHRPLFEATFERDGLLVRADILLPGPDGWTLAEVKSSGAVKDYHPTDVAIQRWAIETSAGLALARTELWRIDTGWTYVGDGRYEGLLVREDLGEAVEARIAQVPDWVRGAKAVLAGPEPAIAMGEQCTTPFDCPFQRWCAAQAGPQPDYPVTLLPNNKGKKLAAELIAEGYADLREVPPERIEDEELAMIARVTREGRPRLDSEAATAIRALAWPRIYLDFETIGFAVPRWAGTRPYQQVPFQWACVIEHKREHKREHESGDATSGRSEKREFFDLSGADPSRRCAVALVRELPREGAVIAYNAQFERGVIERLASLYPDLAKPLRSLAERLFDLLPVVRAHYYHPDMRGSRSIKAVLPTIGAGLDHAELGEVQDGTGAQEAYLEAVSAGTGEERKKALEEGLRRYCGMDVRAMVALAGFLAGTGGDVRGSVGR
ncbi:MAG: DUF2779 domain-containing protein [Burkholderiaceae bacterium]|nr:DUF2779 domain-containing protein [Burkholderiaceae bacterium]MEB2350600.1 DUF2779 domain-containing protein [Burkholderiaceae bacterium]